MRVAIVEDELHAARRLKSLLAEFDDVEVLGVARDGGEGLRLIDQTKPDLALVDISLPGMSGLEFARSIPASQRPIVVFATAFDQHAIEAFEVGALDYLLKPVEIERLSRSLERVRSQMLKARSTPDTPFETALAYLEHPAEGLRGSIWVKERHGALRIDIRDIDWLEAERDYVRIHVGARSHLIRERVHELEKRLDPHLFRRVHRSAIVNVERVKGMARTRAGGVELMLATGSSVPVGASYKAVLASLMKQA